MKNHSSRRAGKGRVAFRTPSRFKAKMPEDAKRFNGHLKNKKLFFGNNINNYGQ